MAGPKGNLVRCGLLLSWFSHVLKKGGVVHCNLVLTVF